MAALILIRAWERKTGKNWGAKKRERDRRAVADEGWESDEREFDEEVGSLDAYINDVVSANQVRYAVDLYTNMHVHLRMM